MSRLSTLLYLGITFSPLVVTCWAWQPLPSAHRSRLQQPRVRLHYREGSYHDTMEAPPPPFGYHYDPLQGGNNAANNNGINSVGPDAWDSESRSRRQSSTFWTTQNERDHEVIGPPERSSYSQGQRRHDASPSFDRRFGGHHHHHHPDDLLRHDSFRHQDSVRSQQAWSPRSQSYHRFADSMVHQHFDDYYNSRGGVRDDISGGNRWNPRKTNSSYAKPEAAGVSGPISSEAFQQGISTHTTIGPMPEYDRRRLARKQRVKQEKEYEVAGGFDGHGNMLGYYGEFEYSHHPRAGYEPLPREESYRGRNEFDHHHRRGYY